MKRRNKKVKFYSHKNKNKKRVVSHEKKMAPKEMNGEERKVIVGTFEKSRNFGFVVPDGKKVDTDIFISKKNTAGARNGQKVLVEITKSATKDRKTEGKILEVIGNQDDLGIDMLCIIKEFELPEEFPKEVKKEVSRIQPKVDKKDIPNRKDFRDFDIFTIDGEDAKDLDDAISIKKHEDGTFTLGVHIADVSYYVPEGSALDKEALLRGTSVYMLDRVIPMLPFELSNGICSLNAGEDRFTISIIMEIDKNGKVTKSRIYKGLIRVTERMSYTSVQAILDGKDKAVLKRYEPYVDDFKNMEQLAHILKKRRISEGYLNLDLPETKILLDEKGKPIEIKPYETSFANEIIEQFMLTANEEIAETFCQYHAPFIYRVHEMPDLEKVEELNKTLYDFGYHIAVQDDKVTPLEFAKILQEIKGKNEEKLISKLILRTLRLAKYEPENKGHFGIASQYYCHFTSPIRRYPDLFIHRIISKYLARNAKEILTPKALNKYRKQAERDAERSSQRERLAQNAEREAQNMKMAEYMEDHIGEQYEAVVSSITSFGMFVELPNTIEGLIRFENMGEDYYDYDEDHHQLIGKKTKRVFHIGDKVTVKAIEASKNLRRVSFEWINTVKTSQKGKKVNP